MPRPIASQSAALLFGGFFLLLYLAFLRYLPSGGYSEFAYFPPASFPFDAMHGFTVEQLALHVARLAFLTPALIALGLGIAPWVPSEALGRPAGRRVVLLAVAVSLLLSTVVLTKILRGWAIVDDEVTYRQQAALIAEGKLAERSIPNWGYEAFTIATPRGLTGKYLFGEPLVQIPGNWLDLPGAVHLVLAGFALLLWYRILRREAGEEVGAWATAFLALSPMFILTNGTGMSHTTSLFCVVAAGYGVHLVRHGREWAGALFAGGAIGFGLAVRMQVMLPMGAVLGLVALLELGRRRRFGPLAALAVSGGFWAALIALYDRAMTGSFLKLPWYLFSPLERFGFGPITNEDGSFSHTPVTALRNLAVSALRWNGWWQGWPLGLAVIVVWAALGRPSAGLRLWLWAGAALVAFNFFYYSPGVSDTGPIYYFELLLPGSLLAGHTVVEARRRWPQLTAALLGVQLLLGTGTFLAEQLLRLRRLTFAMHAPIRAALAQVETPALLLYETVPQESLHAGWVFSFPIRYRSDSDLVVTFPRHGGEVTRALRARYPKRHCYYYRVEPRTLQPQLFECAAAEDLLARAYELPGPAIVMRSTAYKLGFGRSQWLPPPVKPAASPATP